MHFHSPQHVDGNPLQLWDGFDYTLEQTVLCRAVKRDLKPFLQNQRLLSARVNAKWNEVIEDTKSWAMPETTEEETIVRDMLMWALNSAVVPKKRGQELASLHGRIVKLDELGPLWRQVILRRPITWEKQEPNPQAEEPDKLNPMHYAAPMRIQWGKQGSWYALEDVEVGRRAYGFAVGRVRIDSLQEMLEEVAADFLLRLRYKNRDLFAVALARFEVDAPNPDEPPNFKSILESLNDYGPWNLMEWEWIQYAWHWFLPGFSPPPNVRLSEHHVPKPKLALKTLVNPLTPVGDAKGQVMVGRVGRKPLIMNFRRFSGILYEGQPKTGKSTLAGAHLSQLGEKLFWFAVTAGEFEAAQWWIDQFGGWVEELDLPDADNEKDELETIRTDKIDAWAKVLAKFKSYEERGKVSGPGLWRPAELSTRWERYLGELLAAYRKYWQLWFKDHYTDLAILFIDNLSGLLEEANDANLGSMPYEASKMVGNTVKWFVTQGRNYGLTIAVAGHTIKFLDRWGSDFYGSFGMHFSFYENDYTYVTALSPKEGEVYAPRIFVKLPPGLENTFRRREGS